MGNQFGHLFRVVTFGESHGVGIGCVIDGCPSLLPLCEADIQKDLDRRKPGQNAITTQRAESDTCKILSGVYRGKTLGTPICIFIPNSDARSGDYDEIAKLWRPSHADFAYDSKYGIRDPRGGGRSSARETAARVAAGAVAKKLTGNLNIRAWVESVHAISMPTVRQTPTLEEVDATPVRCPDIPTARRMEEFIKKARSEGDSLGGVIHCRIEGLPAGLGEPVFDRFEAELAKAMLSIPATKGFEIGSGFAGTCMTGSQHNDPFCLDENGGVCFVKNHAGGVLGGITSGATVDFRVAFKPTPTISKEQHTLTITKESVSFSGKGRHDPCVLPRAVPVVEAMAAIVCADMTLRNLSAKGKEI